MLTAILFTDDATVYASLSLPDLVRLSILADWFKANKLSVNVAQTNFIVFTKHRQGNAVNIYLNGENISRKEVKFLGAFVDHLELE